MKLIYIKDLDETPWDFRHQTVEFDAKTFYRGEPVNSVTAILARTEKDEVEILLRYDNTKMIAEPVPREVSRMFHKYPELDQNVIVSRRGHVMEAGNPVHDYDWSGMEIEEERDEITREPTIRAAIEYKARRILSRFFK